MDFCKSMLDRLVPVPIPQGAVNLFAGVADRVASSENWDNPALPPERITINVQPNA
jgi:hypothetical protein